MEEYARRCGEWLQAQVARAESNDPQLRPLKERISQIGQAITAENEGEPINEQKVRGLLQEQNAAILALVKHIAAHTGGSDAANPSLKRSANGRPPGPVWRYAVHFRQPGPGALPSSPA